MSSAQASLLGEKETPPVATGCFAKMHRMFCYQPRKPTHRNQLRSRWTVMMLLCMGLFGSYYVFDIPAATEGALASAFEGSQNATSNCTNGIEQNTGSSAAAADFNTHFNLLYSVYSWPNIALPFLGGYISDKLGVRLMAVIFMTLIAFGQLIVALGSSFISANPSAAWATMWVGRTVFGFGGESLGVAQSAFVASYFQGGELAMAMGINLALARVGSVVNNELSAVIASNADVALAYWVGFGLTALCVLSMVGAYYVDVRAENTLRASSGLPALKNTGLLRSIFGICRRKAVDPIDAPYDGSHVGLLDDDGNEIAPPAVVEEQPKEEIHFGAVLKFPAIFWVLTLSCLTVYIDVLTFNNNCADFVTQKYLATVPTWKMCQANKSSLYLTANSIMSITYLVAGFMTPIFGSVCDNIGLRGVFNVFAAGAITGVHLVLGNTTWYPAAPLVILGLCYSIYASALWPSIAIVIEPAFQATAYGLVTAVQNFGLAVSPLIVGKLMPDAHCATYEECVSGWNRTEWFFVYLGFAGVGCGILLNVVDLFVSKYPMLNLTEKALRKRMIAAGELVDETIDDTHAALAVEGRGDLMSIPAHESHKHL